MFDPRIQTLQIGTPRWAITACALPALVLGLLTLHWMTERGWKSSVGAAEAPPDNGAAAAAKDQPSVPPRDTGTVGPTTIEAPTIEYFPQPTKQEAKIREALVKPTSVEFLDLALEDCIAYLKEYHKINIWIARQNLIDQGVAIDQPITLRAAGLTLKSILKLLLEPVQLTYVIENDVMVITPGTTNCGGRLVTRTYPVRDLYRGRGASREGLTAEKETPDNEPKIPRRSDLETAIAKSVAPDSWEELNGPGSMTYVSEAGSLVIRQTAEVHAEVLQLLRDLRDAKRVGLGAPHERPSSRAGWKLRGPKRAETYSIVGVIDLDGDDKSDAGRLHDLIKSIGASIDNEVDEQGVLRIDGEIPDDGRPCITEKTKFVIVGKVPQPAELSDPDEIYASLKIADLYKTIEDQARDRGVRIVSLEDFLRYIGYERVDKSAE